MKPIASGLASALDWLETALAWLAAGLVLYIMATISADVIGRYFLGSPIGWAIEFAEYALLAIPFLSMAWLVREGGHVKIDLVLNALPPPTRATLNAVTNFLAALTCGAAAYFAIATTVSQYERGVVTIGIYPMPKYLLIALIALGLTLGAIELLRATARAWHGER